MPTKKNIPTLTAVQKISVLNRAAARDGFPWSSVSRAITLTDKLGLPWPAEVDQAFADAQAALKLVDDVAQINTQVDWDMLTAPDAAEQLRAVMVARASNASISTIRPEANRAAVRHTIGALVTAAPAMLVDLAQYAKDHEKARRYLGVTGTLPPDLQEIADTWQDIPTLLSALLTTAEGESIDGTLPEAGGPCRFYDFTPEQWIEFLELHETPEARARGVHEYALNRDIPVNPISSLDQLHTRAAKLDQIQERWEKEKAEAETDRLTRAPRYAPHVRRSGRDSGETSLAAQVLAPGRQAYEN